MWKIFNNKKVPRGKHFFGMRIRSGVTAEIERKKKDFSWSRVVFTGLSRFPLVPVGQSPSQLSFQYQMLATTHPADKNDCHRWKSARPPAMVNQSFNVVPLVSGINGRIQVTRSYMTLYTADIRKSVICIIIFDAWRIYLWSFVVWLPPQFLRPI